MAETYDFIVVGAGSAGCVIANRLSADPKIRVLLVEAGPEPRDPWIKVPAGMSRLFKPGPHNWGYTSEPEPYLNNRALYVHRSPARGTYAVRQVLAPGKRVAAEFASQTELGVEDVTG